MVQFKDDKIEHIEDDVKKIQRKYKMYVSYGGYRGALHLGKELVNNAIDECINPNSPGRNIDIHYNENINMLTVTDDGRGIPFEDVVTSCTKLQSSSKFDRKTSGAGENGEIQAA